jgi:hypothetical protein
MSVGSVWERNGAALLQCLVERFTATAEDIRRFRLHLSETGVSICNRNRIMTGLRFLLRVTLRRLDLAAEIADSSPKCNSAA